MANEMRWTQVATFRRRTRRALLAATTFALLACGGRTEAPPPFYLEPLAFTVHSSASDSTRPPAQRAILTHNSVGYLLYAYAIPQSSVRSPVVSVAHGIDGDRFLIYTTLKSGAELGAGTHEGTVWVSVCHDAACTSHVRGSPKAITFTHVVAP